MTVTATVEVNPFRSTANDIAPATVAFIAANKASDGASTPFARSTLAAIVGGLSTADMVESLVIAAFGSPKSEKTSKPIAKVSGLRDLEGGARLYQAWKDVSFIAANLDADAPVTIGEGDAATIVGAGEVRKIVTAFILQDDGAPKALFGSTGVTARVKEAMKAHNVEVMKAHGVSPEADASDAKSEGEGEGDANATRQPITDRINAMMVALRDMSDAEFEGAWEALATMADYVDQRGNAISDAKMAVAA